MHLACTRYLTCMHTGDRSADAINAGGVLPGYQGVIVRDGYAGYSHLTDALHAWCGVHLLRDLKGLYDFEPAQQQWASRMAGLLIEARDAAASARIAGQSVLDPPSSTTWSAATGHWPPPAWRPTCPAHRHREGRPPPRPPVPWVRGPDPAVRDPP